MIDRIKSEPLLAATLAFVATMLIHAADHQIRGTDDLTTEVMAGGTVLFVLATVTLVVVLRRRSHAPHIAAAVGIYTAIGVSASHLAPHWSAFSDPYPDKSLGIASWLAMLSEPIAALIMASVALVILRRRLPAAA